MTTKTRINERISFREEYNCENCGKPMLIDKEDINKKEYYLYPEYYAIFDNECYPCCCIQCENKLKLKMITKKDVKDWTKELKKSFPKENTEK